MKFLVSIHRPNGWDGEVEHSEAMGCDIDAVNAEMVEAGVRVFVGGLQAPSKATSIRRHGDGALVEESGPFLQASEFVDGFWVLDVSDLDEALAWGRKAAAACRGSVEVRPFH